MAAVFTVPVLQLREGAVDTCQETIITNQTENRQEANGGKQDTSIQLGHLNLYKPEMSKNNLISAFSQEFRHHILHISSSSSSSSSFFLSNAETREERAEEKKT